jgi:predicted RNA-binding Zn-ribbon protein involved in translation (DUF1610 family)
MEDDVWGLVECPECGMIGSARRSQGRVDVFLDVETCYHPKRMWNIIMRDDIMPKYKKDVPARIKRNAELGPGELQWDGDQLVLVACPTCGTKAGPGGMVFLTNIGSTGGDPFLCPACGFTGHVTDGKWRKT